jgi:heme-degrading monooxygenase HmoA
MIALFFEVTPRAGQQDRYLEIAASLKPALEASGGVAFLDRFRSLTRPATMLSHQLWVDEASLARWRANGPHYGAQTSGRREVFEDYRLRVGNVVAGVIEPGKISEIHQGVTYNDPARQAERWMVVARSTGKPFEAASGGEAWRSVYDETKFARVADAANRAAGLTILQSAAEDPCVSAAQLVLVSRDYGMFDRREAPQYFPYAKGA